MELDSDNWDKPLDDSNYNDTISDNSHSQNTFIPEKCTHAAITGKTQINGFCKQ